MRAAVAAGPGDSDSRPPPEPPPQVSKEKSVRGWASVLIRRRPSRKAARCSSWVMFLQVEAGGEVLLTRCLLPFDGVLGHWSGQ